MSLTSRGLSKPKLSSRFEKRLNWHGIAGQRNRSIEKGHPSNRESAWVSCNVLSFYEVSAAALKFFENGPSGFLEFCCDLDPEEEDYSRIERVLGQELRKR